VREPNGDTAALEWEILEAVAQGVPLPSLLEKIVAAVERLTPGATASVLVLDHDGRRIRHAVAPGLPEAYNRGVEGQAIGPQAGSCGAAMDRGEAVIVADIAEDPLWRDHRELALSHGLRACWSLPVRIADGRVAASLALYRREPGTPGPAERRLVDRFVQLTAVAVDHGRLLEELQESRDRFEELAQHSEEVFWARTPDGNRMHYVSPAYERIWGRPSAELYADSWRWVESIHPEDREGVAELVRAAHDRDGHYLAEYRILNAQNEVRWIADRGYPVSRDGKVVRVVGTAQDITPRKLAEITLRERLKELRCLYAVLKLTADESRPVAAVCTEIAELLPPAFQHEREMVARVVIDGDEHRSEQWAEPEARLRVPVQGGGSAAGFVEVGYRTARPTEVSGDSLFLEEERALLAAVAAHLGRMLDRRAMTRRLAQSERLRAIGELTGGIAHDFNNLLTVVLGNAELMSERLVGDRGLHGLAETTRVAAERGAELTARLLAFARQQVLDSRAVDVNRLVLDLEPLVRRSVGEQVEVALVLADDLWPAIIDQGQLDSALLNLCINARDAMPEGGLLTIETVNAQLDASYADQEGDLEPGDYVLLAVSDSGQGMEPAVLARAFEPFFTTKDFGQGSGLGLSMVYGFVKQSRGHVRIYSEPGQGTTVRLYLPRAPAAGAGAGGAGEQGEPAAEARTGGERILLVEDDPLVRGHVSQQLESLGYAVISANDGASALAILEGGAPCDLLFTDLMMPGGMNGRQLAEAARRLRPSLPVLYTSGYTETSVMRRGDLEPGVPLLQKPYRRAELAAKLRGALNGGPA